MTTEPLTELELAELRQDVAVLDQRFPVNRDIARLLATLDAERERIEGLDVEKIAAFLHDEYGCRITCRGGRLADDRHPSHNETYRDQAERLRAVIAGGTRMTSEPLTKLRHAHRIEHVQSELTGQPLSWCPKDMRTQPCDTQVAFGFLDAERERMKGLVDIAREIVRFYGTDRTWSLAYRAALGLRIDELAAWLEAHDD